MSKLIIKVSSFVSIFLCIVSFGSCELGGVSTTLTINGTAAISKTPVKDGDVVDLYIDNTVTLGDASNTTESNISIKGKEIGVPDVHYYIDGQEIGHSNKKSEKFAITYRVTNLTIGEHKLSAEAVPQEKGTTFRGGYKSSTFVVEE